MKLSLNLTDLELVLLSTAAQRDDGNVLPLAASIADQMTRIRDVMPGLIDRMLIDEVEVRNAATAWRTADERRYGLVITDAGRASIGLKDPEDTEESTSSSDPAPSSDPGPLEPPAPGATPRATKANKVLELLRRADGATLEELIAATGWLPHTTRAALTGLRKKGHAITRDKRDGATCYRVPAAA